MPIWATIIGVVGMILILFAYGGLQLNRLNRKGLPFLLLNAVGSIGILVSLFFRFNFPATLIEGFWLIISVIGLAHWVKRKRQTT